MSNIKKTIIFKFLPLVILYLVVMAMFLGNSNYESILTITLSIPLVIYIFNKNPKVEFVLRWILYIVAIGLVLYLVNLFLMDYRFFSFMKRTAYNENTVSIFKWNQYFYYHFQYLVYIGIIFLAVRNKKNK